MWFGVQMYVLEHLKWFVSFKPSSGFPLHLEQQDLQGLTSADLPIFPASFAPSSLCFSTIGLLWGLWASPVLPLSLGVHGSLCLECPASCSVCSPGKLPVTPRPSILPWDWPPSLPPAHFLHTCVHYFIFVFPRSFAFELCVSPPVPPFPMHFKLHEWREHLFRGSY